jgi:hypothetical protein
MKLPPKKISVFLLIGCLVPLYSISPILAGNETDVMTAVEQARDAGVPENLLNRMLAFGYKFKLNEIEVTRFVRMTEEAKKEDLPITPLVSKIEEGLAKRVQPQIIQQVLKKELSQYRFTRKIFLKTMSRWDMPKENLRSEELVRLSKTLSMGISEQELKGFLAKAPKAPLSEIADAVELMAALKQSRMQSETVEKIVFYGLREGFFSKTAWDLPLMVHSAKSHKLPDTKIKAAVMEVVKGEKSVMEAHTGLGLDPNDLSLGPQVSGPAGASAGQGQGGGTGHGGSGGSGSGGGGPGGSSGPGSGSGAGGPGSGGSPGGSGPGGGSGSGSH